MFEKAAMLFLYCETPVHAGSGSSLSIVDLPIQRERITNLPIIQASSLKGVLRAEVERLKGKQIAEALFGPETQRAHEHAGCVSPHDARLLLFPVRSLVGVFAWTTCPLVLERFKREATATGINVDWQVPQLPSNSNQALVASETEVVANATVVLEEFAFSATTSQDAKAIAEWLRGNALPKSNEYQQWKEWLPKRFVILPDDAFRDFTQMATEVITRIRIDQEKKTVAPGALWTEEHLPSETLFYAPIFVSKPLGDKNKIPSELKENDEPSAQKVLELLNDLATSKDNQPYLDRLQIGGDETVGRGIVKVRLLSKLKGQASV
ncbi:MAG: type III-B CRISPR module RAMP protein Cmr4 [Armatimonadetes bacterium]|nr:type III-B CRISPR module RAMP protein Cmr4 [Armatimonadota bacterium]